MKESVTIQRHTDYDNDNNKAAGKQIICSTFYSIDNRNSQIESEVC